MAIGRFISGLYQVYEVMSTIDLLTFGNLVAAIDEHVTVLDLVDFDMGSNIFPRNHIQSIHLGGGVTGAQDGHQFGNGHVCIPLSMSRLYQKTRVRSTTKLLQIC